jgi:large subunit ribosomal protein L35
LIPAASPLSACQGLQHCSGSNQAKGEDMPKLKTNRGAAKRIRATANGYKCAQSHLNHILTKKSSKRKRHLGPMNQVEACDVPGVRRMLPYT